jgi:HD-GYP domain-containing protein (c-di-GMP phosphodiesterase class II)
MSKISEQVNKNLCLSKEDAIWLKIAGRIRDIGKIGVGETIPNKADKLTHEEWDEMRRPPESGYRKLATTDEFSKIADFMLQHEERRDGKGITGIWQLRIFPFKPGFLLLSMLLTP